MSDATEQAEQIVAVAQAQHRADELAAFYLRLKRHKIPPAVCYDLTFAEFYPATIEYLEE